MYINDFSHTKWEVFINRHLGCILMILVTQNGRSLLTGTLDVY